ncbi:MAG: hypothetical protein R6V44_05230 [Paracoccaceae bacterium]|jgi:hypothetical protein
MTRSDALDDTVRRTADLPRERSCLRCRTRFESEWSGERICRRCKGTTSWRSGIPHGTSSSGRR